MESTEQTEWVDCEQQSSSERVSMVVEPSAQQGEELLGYASQKLIKSKTTVEYEQVEEGSCQHAPAAASVIDHSMDKFAESSHSTLPVVLPQTGSKEVDCCNYELNKDPTPEVIVKHPNQELQYEQNVGVRYLKPPTPPPSGNIVIREVRPPPVPEAPPLYVRLRPERPKTPPPLIIREAPPCPPKPLPTVVIDKVLPPAPPPPRQVIVEKLPPLPPKPRQVVIEKWLPYEKIKRNIVYQKLPDLPPQKQVRNRLITWTPLKAKILKRYHNLGIVKADPQQYLADNQNQLSDSATTMNAISNFGAQLHYSDAAVASQSGESVYYDDKLELDRLMHTNFHPNEPICAQFVQKYGNSAYSAARTSDRSEEAREIAREYAELRQMHQSGFAHQAECASPTMGSWMSSAYGESSQQSVPYGMGCQQDIFSLYPDFCSGSQFIPNCEVPECPFIQNPNHTVMECQMCQHLHMNPFPFGMQ